MPASPQTVHDLRRQCRFFLFRPTKNGWRSNAASIPPRFAFIERDIHDANAKNTLTILYLTVAYLTVASIANGMVVNAVRWAAMSIHSLREFDPPQPRSTQNEKPAVAGSLRRVLCFVA